MNIKKLALAGAFIAAFATGATAAPLEFALTGVVGSSLDNDAENLTGRNLTATYRADTDTVGTSVFQNATFAQISFAGTVEVMLSPRQGANDLFFTTGVTFSLFNRTGANDQFSLGTAVDPGGNFSIDPLIFSLGSDGFFSGNDIPTLDPLLARPDLTLTNLVGAGVFDFGLPPLENASVVQTLPAAVPVPAALPLLLAGLGGLFFVARRRAV